MNYLIKQPAGIGDIFFLQKAILCLNEYTDPGAITWPVIDEFLWIKDYLPIAYSLINFVPLSSNFDFKEEYLKPDPTVRKIGDTIIVPFQHADWVFPGISVMDAKYKLIGLNIDDYIEYFEFERNKIREEHVFIRETGWPIEHRPYILVNRKYASPPDSLICPYIPEFNEYNPERLVIEIDFQGKHKDYNMFDWCKVIENAEEIHFVETSFNFIIEKLEPKGKLFMYSKHNPPSYNQVQHLFKQPWNYVY